MSQRGGGNATRPGRGCGVRAWASREDGPRGSFARNTGCCRRGKQSSPCYTRARAQSNRRTQPRLPGACPVHHTVEAGQWVPWEAGSVTRSLLRAPVREASWERRKREVGPRICLGCEAIPGTPGTSAAGMALQGCPELQAFIPSCQPVLGCGLPWEGRMSWALFRQGCS